MILSLQAARLVLKQATNRQTIAARKKEVICPFSMSKAENKTFTEVRPWISDEPIKRIVSQTNLAL